MKARRRSMVARRRRREPVIRQQALIRVKVRRYVRETLDAMTDSWCDVLDRTFWKETAGSLHGAEWPGLNELAPAQ